MKHLLILAVAFLAGNAFAGGGGSGVHYSCGSQRLKLGFQLDNRPTKLHFKRGTKVLVHENIFKTNFFVVTSFAEADDTVVLKMKNLDDSQPRDIRVQWLTNSIVNGIRITYTWGMHRDTADDGKCLPLN